MKKFLALLHREWWEWRRTVLGTLMVYGFLLALSLVPACRIQDFESSNVHFGSEWSQHDEHDTGRNLMQQIFDQGWDGTEEMLVDNPKIVLKPYSHGLLAGFHSLAVLILFISLFYFSDALFKERNDGSTLYIRSLPVGDHSILLSKIISGLLAIAGLTLIMTMLAMIHARLLLWVVSSDFSGAIAPVLGQIKTMDYFLDLIVYLLVSLIWLSPLFMYLIFISATVRNRPLVIGIGGPILLFIFLQVVFRNHDLAASVGEIFSSIAAMISDQMLNISHNDSKGSYEILGSFWSYLFSVRTAISIVVAGLFYGGALFMYRRNVSTA